MRSGRSGASRNCDSFSRCARLHAQQRKKKGAQVLDPDERPIPGLYSAGRFGCVLPRIKVSAEAMLGICAPTAVLPAGMQRLRIRSHKSGMMLWSRNKEKWTKGEPYG